MKWRRWTLIVAVLLFSGVVAYCVARTPRYEALKSQGNTLVRQIESYRSAHGEYPQSLKQAHIKAPLTFFGRWQYSHFAANSFDLSLGEYSRGDFQLRYRPASGWYLDD
jgi:type II secretory pathway pseudopilin PulG